MCGFTENKIGASTGGGLAQECAAGKMKSLFSASVSPRFVFFH